MKKPLDREKLRSRTKRLTRAQCLQIFRNLSSYLDGELSPPLCKKIRRHMAGCSNCCAFFNTFKKTVELCKSLPAQPVPRRTKIQLLRKILNQIGVEQRFAKR